MMKLKLNNVSCMKSYISFNSIVALKVITVICLGSRLNDRSGLLIEKIHGCYSSMVVEMQCNDVKHGGRVLNRQIVLNSFYWTLMGGASGNQNK